VITSLLPLIPYLIVLGLLVWLVWYVADRIPLPNPFNKLVKLLAIVIGVVIVITILNRLASVG
jgi:hypothetical protein